ncbi:MAG: hypothetical protein CL677_03370 [Bdellovibrionaceae bacterium]|nr:hypothetical protein [Pseudobdellovibrionaceae bacterium]|tara:strand:- start:6504 stop:7256 length:753 start_codon:yes stop_codon:yes gene_type:complete
MDSHIFNRVNTWIDTPCVLGISGAQGSGKSTLAGQLNDHFLKHNYYCKTISIDDFYLTFEQQQNLAKNTKNPYLKQRGYPGTHDLELLFATLDALKDGKPCSIPRFDKALNGGLGDRVAESQWEQVQFPLEVIIVEGWFLGFMPHFTQIEDPFLNQINENLKDYEDLYSYFTHFLYLKPKEVEYTIDWRVEAEQERRKTKGSGLSDSEAKAYIEKFIPAYKSYAHTVSERSAEFKKYLAIDLDKNRQPLS